MLGRRPDPGTAAGEAHPVPQREERFLADITADANDLARQGWAVVVPEGAVGERLAAQVQALVRARAEEQQADVITLQVGPNLDARAASAWKQAAFAANCGDDEARRPRYLLILGDLDQVSLETQQALAQDGLPGRLAFARDDDYGAYAAKVLAWQREPSRHDRARALFYTVHDGTSATSAGHAKLIQPCHDRCTRTARDKPREFPANTVEAHGAPTPEPGELLALAAAELPSVLLSMSHGLGPPRRRPWSPAEARAHQGAMSFGTEGAIGAEHVASAPFLPGGLWIYFACFGAGTPSTSAYHHWLDMLAHHGMPDLGPVSATLRGLAQGGGFVSGLAKAALANPRGPLAMLGHIDLAWSYSYEELRIDPAADARRITGSNRSVNFFNVMAKLVAGERAGAAALGLRLALGAVGANLNNHYDRCKRTGTVEGATPADALALGNLWMLHQDLHGYALLGDPAVRLPLASHDAREATARTAPADRAAAPLEVRTSEAPRTSGDALPTGGDALPADGDALPTGVDAALLDRLERAVHAIAGGESPGVFADELGIILRSEVVEAVEIYRRAGRAALSRLLAQRHAEEKGRPR